MNSTSASSFVVPTTNEIPRHLIQRQPIVLAKTEIILRAAPGDVIAEDGRVLMAGAIEFQTQIVPGRLTDLCDPDEIYKPDMRTTTRFRSVYDPEIQRGLKETKSGPKEFLRDQEVESMCDDIMNNRFECPQLMWNLRASETLWVYVRDRNELQIFQGVATRPDTNHRHHAIVRTHRQYLQWMTETGSEKWGDYNPARAYGLTIYTDDFKGEAHRFYVYNFLGWRVPSSTAHYIESKTQSPHVHSRLARELMDRSGVLGVANVEIRSNQLSRNTAKMITFATLVESLRVAFPDLDDEAYNEVLPYLVEFLGELSRIRPHEIALLSVAQRQKIRATAMADQAVMWHGYFQLAAWLRDQKPTEWRNALQALGKPFTFVSDGKSYAGDLFSRENPIWLANAILVPGKTGVPRVVNNRDSKRATFEILKKAIEVAHTEEAAVA